MSITELTLAVALIQAHISGTAPAAPAAPAAPTSAPKKKGKVSKYNRLLKAEMAKMKNSRMKPRARFKLAAKRASAALKKGRK